MNLWKDPARRAEVMAKLQKESEVRDEEFVCVTKSGEARIAQFSGTLIELDGKPALWPSFGTSPPRGRAKMRYAPAKSVFALSFEIFTLGSCCLDRMRKFSSQIRWRNNGSGLV